VWGWREREEPSEFVHRILGADSFCLVMGEVAESFETGLKEFESRIGGCENALNSFASAGDRKALEVVERELRAAGGILEDLSLLPDELDTNEESDAAWSRLGIARTRREELSKQMRRLVQENRAVLAHAARQELLQAAQEDTGKGEKSSMGQLASSITSGLRRTHALLENEVARTSTITEVHAQVQAALPVNAH